MNKVTNNVHLQSRNISEFKALTLEINCNLIVSQHYFLVGLWLNDTIEVFRGTTEWPVWKLIAHWLLP